MTYLWTLPSPLGDLHLASDGEGLTGLWMVGQKYFAANVGTEQEEKNLPVFAQTQAWLSAYFAGERPDTLPPLSPRGSEFRQGVWKLLLDIPYGETVSYGQLAQTLQKTGQKAAAQAVGGAVGHNPISILIPCHRVVGASGSLTGYAGGLAFKQKLLELEGVNLEKFYVPKRGTAL